MQGCTKTVNHDCPIRRKHEIARSHCDIESGYRGAVDAGNNVQLLLSTVGGKRNYQREGMCVTINAVARTTITNITAYLVGVMRPRLMAVYEVARYAPLAAIKSNAVMSVVLISKFCHSCLAISFKASRAL